MLLTTMNADSDNLNLRPPMPRTLFISLALLFLLPLTAEAQSSVVINGERVATSTLTVLEQRYQMRIQPGRYWYDARSGAWGFVGGPTMGFVVPGLDVGGPLRADASRGTTNVVINGRVLHGRDVMVLRQLVGTVYPGRYWMDAYGNVGVEGGPALVNLFQLARQAQNRRFYRSGVTDTGYGASGDTFYVMGEDWSVTVTN